MNRDHGYRRGSDQGLVRGRRGRVRRTGDTVTEDPDGRGWRSTVSGY